MFLRMIFFLVLILGVRVSSCMAADEQVGSRPGEHFCPITQLVMTDPVLAADGHTYEREAIQRWIAISEEPLRSPMTNLPFAHKHLTPNLALRALIAGWKSDDQPQAAAVGIPRQISLAQVEAQEAWERGAFVQDQEVFFAGVIARGRMLLVEHEEMMGVVHQQVAGSPESRQKLCAEELQERIDFLRSFEEVTRNALTREGGLSSLMVSIAGASGFNTKDEALYRQHSETFRALESPWETATVIILKEKIGRELFLAAMDLPDGSGKETLIKYSADLGIAAGCLYHYKGLRDGEYGFNVDKAQLPSLRARYAAVKLNELQYYLHSDYLNSLKGDVKVYLDTLLAHVEAGNEVAIAEYLKILREREEPHLGYSSCPFVRDKRSPPHQSMGDALNYYIARGNEVALLSYARSRLGLRRSQLINDIYHVCTSLNPGLMRTDLYARIYLQSNEGSQPNEEKVVEFAEAGSEYARYKLLQILAHDTRGVVTSYAMRHVILDFVAQGSRVGQGWRILGLTLGRYGFKEDPAQARRLRVEYGILCPSDHRAPYHVPFSYFPWIPEIF